MLRNLLGFAVFAVIAMFLLKVVFGLFGLVVGLLGSLLWLAFLGFVIYLILKLFAPETAARVREMIAGHDGRRQAVRRPVGRLVTSCPTAVCVLSCLRPAAPAPPRPTAESCISWCPVSW